MLLMFVGFLLTGFLLLLIISSVLGRRVLFVHGYNLQVPSGRSFLWLLCRRIELVSISGDRGHTYFLFTNGTHIILRLVPVELIGACGVEYHCVVVPCLWPHDHVSHSFLLQCLRKYCGIMLTSHDMIAFRKEIRRVLISFLV